MDDASPNPTRDQRIAPLPQDRMNANEPIHPHPNRPPSPLFRPIILAIVAALITSLVFKISIEQNTQSISQQITENHSIEMQQLTHRLQKLPTQQSNKLARISATHGLELAFLKNKLDLSVSESKRQHRNKITQIKNSNEKQLLDQKRTFETLVRDSTLWDGSQARALRDREWQERTARKPQFAVSPMEKAMLQMQAAASNNQLEFHEVLKRVATLASPPGSRIDIKDTSHGYFIRVAFALSALNPDEKGAVTKHPNIESLRIEIEKCSAEVMRDLYEHCGVRRIAKIAVSCNHAVRPLHPGFELNDHERAILESETRPTMSCPFRCSIDNAVARQVTSWKSMPIPKIIALMRIEKDTVRDIQITDSGSRNSGGTSIPPSKPAADPPLPLRFD